ncbi:MAG: iron dependent repressor, metal binding and dimerization domain protein [Clostridia bacterium]|nr:iron dependent repressor, metal binding and dimerization domain protein [Clostridia bacterium]MDR3643658.1 iron dependent repressor, metal binding and dimerization domain protein [Clostridia bacterium]
MKNIPEFHTVRGYQLLEHRGQLSPSMEDYLEMIYRASLEGGAVRVSAISLRLNVRPPSATKMVQRLADAGFLSYRRYDTIELTSDGRALGEYLYDRHNTVGRFLSILGVKENLLEETELIEHSISQATLKRLARFNELAAQEPDLLKKLDGE